ncbi:hypothetical protein E0K83_15875 [Gramella sp. BOM4]|nr:hypothetical protein [Christiangramia bathymodioli]
MKSLSKTLLVPILLFLFSFNSIAQKDRYQMYVVHEDHVAEGKMDKHTQADKALLDAVKEHNIDMSWVTFQSDDNRVMYLMPINTMADLDEDPFEKLAKKMGEQEMEKLFESFGDTYSEHGDYILKLDKELSYMPDGITQTPAGKDYREITYYWIPPGKEKKAEEVARAAKELYTKKGSNVHYRLYKSGFGTMGNYYMVAVAAEDADALEKMRNENVKLLGEEGQKLSEEIQQTMPKQERYHGKMRMDLSYASNN